MRIKVLGIGGGGGNSLNYMAKKGIEGVEFIAIDSDPESLEKSKADVKIQIGKTTAHKSCCGLPEDYGQNAVKESKAEIQEALSGSDMVFILAGMGGATGTGAAVEIVNILKELGIFVIALVTEPFIFEGKLRTDFAQRGIENLRQSGICIFNFPNQKIMMFVNNETTMKEAFEWAGRRMYYAVREICCLAKGAGGIKLDFSNLKEMLKGNSNAMIVTGISEDVASLNRTIQHILADPFLGDFVNKGAKSLLMTLSYGVDIRMTEPEMVNNIIYEYFGETGKYIFCLGKDVSLGNQIKVVLLVTKAEQRKS